MACNKIKLLKCLLLISYSDIDRGKMIFSKAKKTRYYRHQNKCNPQGVYLAISKLRSILAIGNLHVHNNISHICYCGQISSHLFRIYFAGNGTRESDIC